jgi:hypothetical protein
MTSCLTLYKTTSCRFLQAASCIRAAPFRFETKSFLVRLEDAYARRQTISFRLTGTTSFSEGRKGVLSVCLETTSFHLHGTTSFLRGLEVSFSFPYWSKHVLTSLGIFFFLQIRTNRKRKIRLKSEKFGIFNTRTRDDSPSSNVPKIALFAEDESSTHPKFGRGEYLSCW